MTSFNAWVGRRAASQVAVLLLLLTAAPASAWEWASGPSIFDEEGERSWSVEVLPYLWLASLSGELSLPPATGTLPVDASFGDIASNLEGGFAGLLDLRYRRWHLISDNSWVSLGIDQSTDVPAGTAPPVTNIATKIDASVAFGTVAAAYELPLGRRFALDVYLAARWWHVTNSTSLEITTAGPGAPGPFAGELTESWVDAVVGARWRLPITDKWRVSANADVGAGQADIDWSAMGGVSYFFNAYVGMTASYRVLGVDYEKAGFQYDFIQHGLLLGLNLRY